MIDRRQSTPVAPCPECQQEGAWLPDISALRGANCFYCPACRKIWEPEEGRTVPMMTSAPDQLDLQCASCATALTSIHFTIGGDASDLWDR